MSRRKGVPCACDPCKGKNYVRAVNNVSPDPNGDLIIRGGQGIEIIQSGDDLVINNTANPNAFVAGNNIELNPSGDDISINLTDEPVVDGLTINGDLEVNGDIIQNGSAYETHAEQVYTKDDYIIMREGAVSGLSQGDYSGLQVKLYDGVNDGRLVIDNSGIARVGDVSDEQPLLTRDEAADLTDGDSLIWDAANSKAVTAAIPSAIATALAGKQDDIALQSTALTVISGVATGGGYVYKFGKVCWATVDLVPTGAGVTVSLNFPTGYKPARTFYTMVGNYVKSGYALAYFNGTSLSFTTPNGNGQCCVFIYMTNE